MHDEFLVLRAGIRGPGDREAAEERRRDVVRVPLESRGEREQGVRKEFENKLKLMTLMEKQATRYAEDLAGMLRSERERRQELERALEQERIASEELRRTGLQGISHLLLAATIKDRTTGTHLQRVRRYVEAIASRLGLPAELVEEFGYSSVMHDVGKIHTPDHILQSEHHLSDETIRGYGLEEAQRPVLALAPAERLVIDRKGAGRQHLAVIPAVHDLVDVTERDVRGGHTGVGQQPDLLESAGAGLAMGVDRDTRPEVRGRRGSEDGQVACGWPAPAPAGRGTC